MKLSAREIKFLIGIEKRRKHRKIAAWLGLGVVVVLFGIGIRFEIASVSFSWVFAIFLGITILTLPGEYFGVRAEDKLIDLLQRYVNTDPEAIQQMAETVVASGHAA